MIAVPAGARVMVATKPVDFRLVPTAWSHWFARRLGRILSPEQFLFSARSGPTG